MVLAMLSLTLLIFSLSPLPGGLRTPWPDTWKCLAQSYLAHLYLLPDCYLKVHNEPVQLQIHCLTYYCNNLCQL